MERGTVAREEVGGTEDHQKTSRGGVEKRSKERRSSARSGTKTATEFGFGRSIGQKGRRSIFGIGLRIVCTKGKGRRGGSTNFDVNWQEGGKEQTR